MRTWVRRRWLHDADHGQALVEWRKQLPDMIKGQRMGPKYNTFQIRQKVTIRGK
jgi:hypothetical protein